MSFIRLLIQTLLCFGICTGCPKISLASCETDVLEIYELKGQKVGILLLEEVF